MKKLIVMLVAMMALTQMNAQIWAGGSKRKIDKKKEVICNYCNKKFTLYAKYV